MRRSKSDNGKLFYVVHFLELPFNDIGTYVCVPHSWIILRIASCEKAAITYPNNEDPLTIRDWVKNKQKPNDEWRLFIAIINYESDTFEDADNWIKTQNDHEPSKIKTPGSQLECLLDRKLRSASRPLFCDTKSDKPSVTVKPNKNSRKPLSRISIMLPLQSMVKKKIFKSSQEKVQEKTRVKFDKIASPVNRLVNHPRTVSEDLKEKQSIIVSDNKLIQNAQTGTAAALDDKTSSEQTLPDFIKGDKSVTSDQSASPELPHKNHPSPPGHISEQALSLTDTDTGFDEDDHEDDVNDHVQFEPLKENAPFPGKSPTNNPEHVPQSESVNERSTPLVHHKHSLLDLRLQNVPVRQSKEADVNPRTQIPQILTTPLTVPRPSNTLHQLSQGKYPQPAFMPSTRVTNRDPRLQGTNRGSSTEVTHNHQSPCSQGFISNTSFQPYCATNLMSPSAESLHPSIKKKSSAAENPVAKRICLENITSNILSRQQPSSSTARLHLFDNSVCKPVPRHTRKQPENVSRQPNNARCDFQANPVDLSISQQVMATSTARNLSYLAQQSRSLVEQSNLQNYLLMLKHYSEQTPQWNSTYVQPNIGSSTNQHAHLPCAMKPNLFGQTNQLLSQHNNQFGVLKEDSMQEVLSHEITRRSIGGAHISSANIIRNFENITQYPAQNSLIQSHYNFDNRQERQDLPRYQDLTGHSLKYKAGPQETDRQEVIQRTRSPALPKSPSQSLLNVHQDYSFQDPRVWVKLNQNPTEHQIINPVVFANLINEVKPTMVNAEVQTALSPDRLDKTPSELLPEIGTVYQNPRTKKLVVDQATETEPVMDADHCENKFAESSDKSSPQVADSGCQTDRYFIEEQDSSYQETDSESEISTHDVVLDRGECEDHPLADTVSEIRPMSPQNPQMQQRLAAEQEMLNTFGTLLTQMGISLHHTCDMYNNLRNSIVKCADVYESLLEQIEKFNEIQQFQISTSLPNDDTLRASNKNISENSSAKNITGISSAPKMNPPQKNRWVLPPAYDPNNPKWTRKYQKKGPELVELIPRTNVYVSKKELNNCKRESKDCRTLARMLLTIVFSRDALSVCSLTDGKAKALNLDVRPGLDEEARMVLLTFVERYGAQRGWKTDDTSAIINSMRTKILEIRTKYGQVGGG